MKSVQNPCLQHLTEIIFLEPLIHVPDGQGGLRAEWQEGQLLWAHIKPVMLQGIGEQWQGDRPHFSARYEVWLRQEHELPSLYRLRWAQGILTPISAVTYIPGKEWQKILTHQEEEPVHER